MTWLTPRVALLVFAGLTILHTWPLATNPAHLSLNHNADAQQWAWQMSWIAHAMARDPWRLFDGNIFAPEPRTLAFSDPAIVPALAAAPVRIFGGSPVLAFNGALLVGLTLTAFATWWVVRRWTGSPGAALVAGALAAFNPHLLTRLPHIVAAFSWTIPVALVLADRLLDLPRRRTALGLAVVVAATAATSLYALALVGILTGLVMVIGLATGRIRGATMVALASIGGLIIAAPVLAPYAAFGATGVTRPIESVAQFSATGSAYLATPSAIHARWSQEFFDRDVGMFFAGFTACALALMGLAAGIMTRGARRRAIVLGLVAITGIVLSLGPATPIYAWLYDWVAPLRALRAAARFGYLYLVAVALAAGLGVAWIEPRIGRPSARAAFVLTALALVTLEAWSGPVRTQPFSRIPAIYDQLKKESGRVLLVEFPFYPPEAIHDNAEYEFNSTAHWRPLLNGYSGFIPMSYRDRVGAYWYFPDARAFDRMALDQVTHAVVHLERFTLHERSEIDRVMRSQSTLRLMASDADGHRLYRVLKSLAQGRMNRGEQDGVSDGDRTRNHRSHSPVLYH